MQNILDFIRAALPWVAVGLLAVILGVKHAGREKKEKPQEDYGAEGMCIGMCLGMAISSVFGSENMGIGSSLGMLIGLAVGSSRKKQ